MGSDHTLAGVRHEGTPEGMQTIRIARSQRSISHLFRHRGSRGHQRRQDLRRNAHRRLPQGQGDPLLARRLWYRAHQPPGVSYSFIYRRTQSRTLTCDES